MDPYEEKLKHYLKDNHSTAEHLTFPTSCHSVAEAAHAAKTSPEDFIKSIVFVCDGKVVIAIVRGVHRADGKKAGTYVGGEVQIAKPEVLALTGYPIGGVPPVGYEARVLIDPEVMKREAVFGGGGSDKALLKIATEEVKRLTNAEIVDVKKD